MILHHDTRFSCCPYEDYVTRCPVAVFVWRELDTMTIFRKKAAEALVCPSREQRRVLSERRLSKSSCLLKGLHENVRTAVWNLDGPFK